MLRKMQVLPHGGQFDKDPLVFGPDDELRRREEAVQATLRTMKVRMKLKIVKMYNFYNIDQELAHSEAISHQSQAYIKIQEAVTICL